MQGRLKCLVWLYIFNQTFTGNKRIEEKFDYNLIENLLRRRFLVNLL